MRAKRLMLALQAGSLAVVLLSACGGGGGPRSVSMPSDLEAQEVAEAAQPPEGHVADATRSSQAASRGNRPASAPQRPPTTKRRSTEQTASLRPASVEAGEQEVVVHGHGWGPRSIINIRLVQPGPGRAEFITFTVAADADGVFTGRFIVPSEVQPGDHLVEVTSRSGGYVALSLKVRPSTNASADEGAGPQPACDHTPDPGEQPREGCLR